MGIKRYSLVAHCDTFPFYQFNVRTKGEAGCHPLRPLL
jgi:hypothetical protein